MPHIRNLQETQSHDEKACLSYECLKGEYPSTLINYCAGECVKSNSENKKEKEIKLCFFTHNLSLQGAPLALYNYIKSLKQEKSSTVTISPSCDDLSKDFLRLTGKLIFHKFLGEANPPSAHSLMTSVDKATILLTYIRPEKLLINTTRGWILALACQRLDLEYSWWIHEAETPFQFITNQYVREEAIKSIKNTRSLIFASNATKERYSQFLNLNNATQSKIVQYPIATRDIFSAFASDPITIQAEKHLAREKLCITKQEVCLLNIGTLCRRKNQIELIDALSSMDTKTLKNVRLLIIGSGIEDPFYATELKEKAILLNERHKASKIVEILPPTEDILIYFIAADWYIHTSVFECFSQTVNEAKSMCLKILVRESEGMDEVLAGYSQASTYETLSELTKDIEEVMHKNNSSDR